MPASWLRSRASSTEAAASWRHGDHRPGISFLDSVNGSNRLLSSRTSRPRSETIPRHCAICNWVLVSLAYSTAVAASPSGAPAICVRLGRGAQEPTRR
jgi:hypothetical protein